MGFSRLCRGDGDIANSVVPSTEPVLRDDADEKAGMDLLASQGLVKMYLSEKDTPMTERPVSFRFPDVQSAPWRAFQNAGGEVLANLTLKNLQQTKSLKLFWHGTKSENVDSILERGFLPQRVHAYGNEMAFWFSPFASVAKLHTDHGVPGQYTLLLCATLFAQEKTKERYTVNHNRPQHCLPLVAVTFNRAA